MIVKGYEAGVGTCAWGGCIFVMGAQSGVRHAVGNPGGSEVTWTWANIPLMGCATEWI